jgi:antitoxin component YwqK of YwqJK toxin-antitoxin module
MKTFLIGILISAAAIGISASLDVLADDFQVSAVDNAKDVAYSEFNRLNGVLFDGEEHFTGQVVATHENGRTMSIVHYVDGQMHGLNKEWFADGQIASKRRYENGRKMGLHLGWWEDGSPRFEFNFENGLYEGNVNEWALNGVLVKAFHYHLGKEDGAQKMWTTNGKIKANYVMINGRRYGYIGSKNCVSADESM